VPIINNSFDFNLSGWNAASRDDCRGATGGWIWDNGRARFHLDNQPLFGGGLIEQTFIAETNIMGYNLEFNTRQQWNWVLIQILDSNNAVIIDQLHNQAELSATDFEISFPSSYIGQNITFRLITKCYDDDGYYADPVDIWLDNIRFISELPEPVTCIIKRDEGIYSKPTYCYLGEGIFSKILPTEELNLIFEDVTSLRSPYTVYQNLTGNRMLLVSTIGLFFGDVALYSDSNNPPTTLKDWCSGYMVPGAAADAKLLAFIEPEDYYSVTPLAVYQGGPTIVFWGEYHGTFVDKIFKNFTDVRKSAGIIYQNLKDIMLINYTTNGGFGSRYIYSDEFTPPTTIRDHTTSFGDMTYKGKNIGIINPFNYFRFDGDILSYVEYFGSEIDAFSTFRNVTLSRGLNNIYQNITGKRMLIVTSVRDFTIRPIGETQVYIFSDENTLPTLRKDHSNCVINDWEGRYTSAKNLAIIEPDHYYEVRTSTGFGEIESWVEYY